MRKKFVSAVFIVVIFFVLFTSTFVKIFMLKTSDNMLQFLNTAVISDEKVSSTTQCERESYPSEQAKEDETFLSRTNSTVNNFKNIFSRCVTTTYLYRIQSVLIQKFWEKNILRYNMTTSLNGTVSDGDYGDIVVAYQNGQLAYLFDDIDITGNIEKFIAFGKEMQNEGRNFLLFLTPSKTSNNEIASNYFGCYKDYTAKNEEQLTNSLKKANVDYVLCEKIKLKIGKGEQIFFNTDHHWLPQTALLGCKELSDFMNKNYGYAIDTSIYDLDNYIISESPYPFLGSQGKKVTEIYADPEPFPIIKPKYASDYSVFISGLNKTTRGTIYDTLINTAEFSADLYNSNQYAVYGYGDQKYIHIHNNESNDGKRVLIIKHSMADTMVPYLGNIAEDVDVIDLRIFNESLKTFIAQTNPDTIIFVYGANSFRPSGNSITGKSEQSVLDSFDFE